MDKSSFSSPPDVSDETGSILIEVLVSAILLTITAVGVFSAIEAGGRSTAEERHRAQADGLAQADLARMRTMRISDLSNLDETKVVTIDATPYTVKSAAEFQTDSTGTASCEDGKASADYIQIRSTVTWPSIGTRPPVVAQSLVAPPNGSVSPDSGALAIQIEDAENIGIEGVDILGTGAATFSGTTGPNGCAIFGNLPKGEYTLAVSGVPLVDHEGEPAKPPLTSVVAESTNTLVLQYDEPGEVPIAFQTRVEGELVPSQADSVIAFNSGMTLPKAFGTPGEPQAELKATSLFPFTSLYAVYAGVCKENNPSLVGAPDPSAALVEVLVLAGGSTPVTLELPALHLEVWSGSGAGEPGALLEGAQVKLADTKCSPEEPFVRTYTTDETGGLPDPGLPFSTYDVCASDGKSHVTANAVSVPANPEEMEIGTELDIYLGNPSAEPGACP